MEIPGQNEQSVVEQGYFSERIPEQNDEGTETEKSETNSESKEPQTQLPVEHDHENEEGSMDSEGESDYGSLSDNQTFDSKIIKKDKFFTCFYCEFSVEKMKYMKAHIQTFHNVDATLLEKELIPQPVLELNSNNSTMNEMSTMTAIQKPEPSGSNQNQTKKFDMDLCPYCDFSDKNEKKLRHHILSKHSKELDKIIVYTSDEHSPPKKVQKINESAKVEEKVLKSFNNGNQKNVAQVTKMPYNVTKIKHETSDNNQNDILPCNVDEQGTDQSFNNFGGSSVDLLCCPQCDYTTYNSYDLILHGQSHGGDGGLGALASLPGVGGMVESFLAGDGGGLKGEVKLFYCDHCDYTTPRQQLLNRHLLSKHTDRKPHQCHECSYATKRLEHLNRHILSKHSGQRPFPCQFCDYRASRDDHLRNHVLSKHAGEQLKCVHCGYSALSTDHLNSHILTKHSDVQSFSCHKCSFITAKEEDLTTHMLCIHSEEKPFLCDSCDFTTSSCEELDQHALTVHSAECPFKCTMCEYASTRGEFLNYHIQSKHAGERPHVCPECDYRATRVSHLTRHIQSKHAGVKPFLCSQCDYRAGRMEHLHRHILNRHSDLQPAGSSSYPCHSCRFVANSEELLNHHILSMHVEGGYGSFCDTDIKAELSENDETSSDVNESSSIVS